VQGGRRCLRTQSLVRIATPHILAETGKAGPVAINHSEDHQGPNLLWHLEDVAGEELDAVQEGSMPASRLRFLDAAIVWIVDLKKTTSGKWKH